MLYLSYLQLLAVPFPPPRCCRQAEETLELPLSGLQLPARGPPHTELLDLDPLPLAALGKQQYIDLYRRRFTHFNPIQTQVRPACSPLLGALSAAVCAGEAVNVNRAADVVASGGSCTDGVVHQQLLVAAQQKYL